MSTPSTTPPAAFRTILVPLDGSELAERALPYARRLARTTNSPLLLVRVIPLGTWAFAVPGGIAPAEAYQTLLDDEDRAAQDYLTHTAEALRADGPRVTTLAARGEPAATLIELEAQESVELVVMATHGRLGMARFALGSVADRVVRVGTRPVLLVRPFGPEIREPRLERAVVPLDGSAVAELALEQVARLAGGVLRHVTLVRAVDPERRAGETEEARRYLEQARVRLVDQLAGRACDVETSLLYGEAGEQIIARAQAACDLVVMATRGHLGADRWAYGSTADRVLHGLSIPLLLVRPQPGG